MQQIRARQFNVPRTRTAQYHQQPTPKGKAEERVNERVQHILNTLPGETKINILIDIGAGNAEITDKIAKTFNLSQAYALDKYPANEFIKPFPNSIVQYIQVMNENLPFHDNSIDMITAFMSIHHIQDIESLIKEICRVLKPNGYLFFRENDVTSNELKLYLDKIHERYEKNPHEHSINPTYYWSRQAFSDFLTQRGFIKIGDSDYDPQKNPQAIYHSLYQNTNCK